MSVRILTNGRLTPSQTSPSSRGTLGANDSRRTSQWIRPAEWLAMPDLTGLQRFAGLYAIFPDGNFVALSAQGNYTVDWGDGTTTNHNSNTIAYKQYTYSSISNAGESTLGYRQVLIQVYPQSGQNLTNINLQRFHNQSGLNATHRALWLDIAINAPNMTTASIGGGSPVFPMLQRAWIQSHALTNCSNLFSYCYSLQDVPLFNTANVTNMSIMFRDCYALTNVPLFNTANVTDMSVMFFNCYSLTDVPLFNTVKVTVMGSMFTNCWALQSLPLFNTSNVTSFSQFCTSCYSLRQLPLLDTAKVTNWFAAFQSCSSLQSVPAFNMSAATTLQSTFQSCARISSFPAFSTALVTNMNSTFNGCFNLQQAPNINTAAVTNAQQMFQQCLSMSVVPALNFGAVTSGNFASAFSQCGSLATVSATGINQSVSFSNCKLSAAALNTIFTNLSSTGTGKTITVTGNYGAATCDTSIATAKGWTVTV